MLARHPLVWAPPSLAETNATATAGASERVVTTAAGAIEAMNSRLLLTSQDVGLLQSWYGCKLPH